MSATRKPLPSRHETFCQHVAEGCSLAEAARHAGYSAASAKQRGWELVSRPEIQARVDELAAETRAERKALRARTLTRLDAIHDKAVETGRTSLAFRAVIAIARIAGLNGGAARPPRAESAIEQAVRDDMGPEPAPQHRNQGRNQGRSQIPPELAAALDDALVTPVRPPARPGASALGGAAQLPASVLGAMQRPAPATGR